MIGAVALAACMIALDPATRAEAADYPTRAIDLYIGSAPAGSTDALGRALARALEPLLGQPVVVHNTPGAGGAVMATQLEHAAPDGYSLGMAISHAYSGNPVVLPATTRYTVDDFTHLASVSKGQCALVTSAAKPYNTLDDLIEAARRGAEPVYASQSPLTRVLADYLAEIAGVRFRVITVQGGGEIMQAILGGHADFGFSGGPHVDHVAAGQMRVLAATEDTRLATSPEAPTLKELGYDISSCALFVVSAPPNLPDDLRQRLSAALAEAMGSPDMRAMIRNLKLPEHYLGPDEVTRVLAEETATLQRALARIERVTDSAPVLSSSFMPYVAAALGLAALALLGALRVVRGAAPGEPGSLSGRGWLFISTAATVLAVTFVLMQRFGYLAGAAAIVAGFMLMAHARPRIVVIVTVALPVVLWLFFEKLLGFPLP